MHRHGLIHVRSARIVGSAGGHHPGVKHQERRLATRNVGVQVKVDVHRQVAGSGHLVIVIGVAARNRDNLFLVFIRGIDVGIGDREHDGLGDRIVVAVVGSDCEAGAVTAGIGWRLAAVHQDHDDLVTVTQTCDSVPVIIDDIVPSVLVDVFPLVRAIHLDPVRKGVRSANLEAQIFVVGVRILPKFLKLQYPDFPGLGLIHLDGGGLVRVRGRQAGAVNALERGLLVRRVFDIDREGPVVLALAGAFCAVRDFDLEVDLVAFLVVNGIDRNHLALLVACLVDVYLLVAVSVGAHGQLCRGLGENLVFRRIAAVVTRRFNLEGMRHVYGVAAVAGILFRREGDLMDAERMRCDFNVVVADLKGGNHGTAFVSFGVADLVDIADIRLIVVFVIRIR